MAILTRSRRKSGRWGLIVANYSPGKLITLRTRPPSLSLPLSKIQKKPSSNPQFSHPTGDGGSLLFSKHTFQVRFEVVSWRKGIFFFLSLQSTFMGSPFFSWLGFEVSPFILAFSLWSWVPFSLWCSNYLLLSRLTLNFLF